MRKKSSILLAIFILSISNFAQVNLIPEKYLQIKPAVSTREDVEKIYGRDNLKEYMMLYKTPDGIVNVKYSDGSCTDRNGHWNLPEWTVEEVFYAPNGLRRLPLADVVLDSSKFKSKNVGIVLGQVEYFNENEGISVIYFKDDKTVQDITISLNAEQRKSFNCAAKGTPSS